MVNLLFTMINEFIKQRGLHHKEKDGMRDVTVDFCAKVLLRID